MARDEKYYFEAREKIHNQLARLPRGTLKERCISGRKYYYLQNRQGKKVIHKYLGKEIPVEIKKGLKRRENLSRELGKIQDRLMAFWVAKI